MTKRSLAITRCENELRAIGIPLGLEELSPPTENEERILDCFDKLHRSLTISKLYELECLLYYLRKYWEEVER